MAPARISLPNTFLHIRGIGPKKERELWERGATDWSSARAADLSWLGRNAAEIVREACAISEERLARRDAAFFSYRLPTARRLQLYEAFRDDAAFLDIETDPYEVTLAGVQFRGRYRTFVRGEDLDELPAHLESAKLVVTYSGSAFDLPILLRSVYREALRGRAAPLGASARPPRGLFNLAQGVHIPGLGHVDLRFVLRSFGLRGGLKRVEAQLGISRPEEVAGLDGADAVILWHRHLAGDSRAFELLVAYNREDVVNLEKIADMLLERAGCPLERAP
ncbi:MAG: ribonuclease H-like domain-containing protein [Planctomycetota bacterium]